MDPIAVSKTLSLRSETAADADFVAGLFRAERAPRFAQAGCPDLILRPLLDDQFRLQSLHFTGAYPALDRRIVVRAGQPIGRLYVDRDATRWHIVEIGLLPGSQGQGIGAELIGWLATAATKAGVPALELEVAHDNVRAAALYRRLGFAALGGISASHLAMRRVLK